MSNTKKIYNGLRSHYGAMKRLAEARGVSERWVTLVLTEKQTDEDLVLEAARLWEQLEKEKTAKIEEAARLANSAETIIEHRQSAHLQIA
ncbi:MAG: hypothetical protein JNM22_02050 [Saprospiraceae bacterium]|nr:hypothetical protein [Saprospiraceae bacterium]